MKNISLVVGLFSLLMFLTACNFPTTGDVSEADNSTGTDTSDDGSSSSLDESGAVATSGDTSRYGLDSNRAPAQNFDLWDWYLSIPTDEDGSGTADSIKEDQLNEFEHDDNEDLTFDGLTGLDYYESDYFYTGDDGAMVFVCKVGGYKTSSGTSYTRSELREMLRRGDTSFGTSSSTNNWAFGSIDPNNYGDFGGIDGTLTATLAVNKVTSTAIDIFGYDEDDEEYGEMYKQTGRIIIGQIHAENNEPIRLYYHKLPEHTNGSIYFAHEPSSDSDEDETWHGLLGNMIDDDELSYVDTDDMPSLVDPSDGIALGEIFSYSIDVSGDFLTVTISDQEGVELAYKQVDMSDSGYDDADNYQYFKAGIYLNDKYSDEDDTAIVSFYELSNTHTGYGF